MACSMWSIYDQIMNVYTAYVLILYLKFENKANLLNFYANHIQICILQKTFIQT